MEYSLHHVVIVVIIYSSSNGKANYIHSRHSKLAIEVESNMFVYNMEHHNTV